MVFHIPHINRQAMNRMHTLATMAMLVHISCQEYKIRNPANDMYIGLDGKYPRWVPLERANTFKNKESSVQGQVIIEVIEHKGKVWDIEGNKRFLIWYPEHGRANQRFIFVGNDNKSAVIKSSNGQCMRFSDKDKRFERVKCVDGDASFLFVIVDEKEGVVEDVVPNVADPVDKPAITPNNLPPSMDFGDIAATPPPSPSDTPHTINFNDPVPVPDKTNDTDILSVPPLVTPTTADKIISNEAYDKAFDHSLKHELEHMDGKEIAETLDNPVVDHHVHNHASPSGADIGVNKKHKPASHHHGNHHKKRRHESSSSSSDEYEHKKHRVIVVHDHT